MKEIQQKTDLESRYTRIIDYLKTDTKYHRLNHIRSSIGMSPNVLGKRMEELVGDGMVERNDRGFRIRYLDFEEKKMLDGLRIAIQIDKKKEKILNRNILNLAEIIAQNLKNEHEFLEKRKTGHRIDEESRPDISNASTLINIIKSLDPIKYTKESVNDSNVDEHRKKYINESIIGLYIRKTLKETNVSWELIKDSLPEQYWKIKGFTDFWQLFGFMIMHDLELDDFDTIELNVMLDAYGENILEKFKEGKSAIIKEIQDAS